MMHDDGKTKIGMAAGWTVREMYDGRWHWTAYNHTGSSAGAEDTEEKAIEKATRRMETLASVFGTRATVQEIFTV